MSTIITVFIIYLMFVLFFNIIKKQKKNKEKDITINRNDIVKSNQYDEFKFYFVFYWVTIEPNLFRLKFVNKKHDNVYIIVCSNSIYFNKIEGWDGEYIKYNEQNVDARKMFNFEITDKIEIKGLQFPFKYPQSKGLIHIYSKDILKVIPNHDLFTSYFKIKLDTNELVMDFDCREETYELVDNKRREFEIRKAEIELKERKEREEREIRNRILKREQKKRKEKEIYNKLLDEGFIYPDESNKRPPIPKDVIDAVWRRDKGQCVYCGSKENLQLDHIIPFSKGGATNFENLQLLCQKCNIKKSNNIG